MSDTIRTEDVPSTANKGTGAGGANTNYYGKKFEEKTNNQQRLLDSGNTKHSFTKKPKLGPFRIVDMGLLVKHDEQTAKGFQNQLSLYGAHLNLGINEPYSAHDLNHTIDENVAPRSLRHLAIEIRQDHVDTNDKAVMMAGILSNCIKPIID